MAKQLNDVLPRYQKLLTRMLDMSSTPGERATAREAALKLEAEFPGLRAAAAKAKVGEAASKVGAAAAGPWGPIFEHATAVFGQRAVDFLANEFDWAFGGDGEEVDDDLDAFADELTEDWDIEVDGEVAYFDGSMDIEMLREAAGSGKKAKAVLRHLIEEIDAAEEEDEDED